MKFFYIVTLLMLSACSTSQPDLKYADGSKRVPVNPKRSSTIRPPVMQISPLVSAIPQTGMPVVITETPTEKMRAPSIEPLPLQTSQEISFTDQDKRKTRRKCPAPNSFVDRASNDQILVLKISTDLGNI